MSTITPIQTNDQLAQTVRNLRLDNEQLKQQLDTARETIQQLEEREHTVLVKVRELMADIARYKKQFSKQG